VTPEGAEKYLVDRIIGERRGHGGIQYLVRWVGYGSEEDLWLPRSNLKDNVALDIWLAGKKRGEKRKKD
jgi:hypothetical protein